MAVDYHRYMASREWALKREEVKERTHGVCERCHDSKVHNVHHLSYQRLGSEILETDLVGLCRPCHEFLSAKRDDDPAIIVVSKLIEQSGARHRFIPVQGIPALKIQLLTRFAGRHITYRQLAVECSFDGNELPERGYKKYLGALEIEGEIESTYSCSIGT